MAQNVPSGNDRLSYMNMVTKTTRKRINPKIIIKICPLFKKKVPVNDWINVGQPQNLILFFGK